MPKIPSRKRPCRICRRWFLPDPRLKERQMTCGKTECQREWHRKKCAEWNRKNTDYFKTNYLQKKIDAATQPRGDPGTSISAKHFIKIPASRMRTGMPLEYAQEVIGIQFVIIHEYMAHLLDRRWRQAIHVRASFPPTTLKLFSRGDKRLVNCNH